MRSIVAVAVLVCVAAVVWFALDEREIAPAV